MTAEVELRSGADATCSEPNAIVDTRTWCFDCYDRREPWVVRSLAALGVEFRHTVLAEPDVCRSCKTSLPTGLHAVAVTIPTCRPPAAESNEESP